MNASNLILTYMFESVYYHLFIYIYVKLFIEVPLHDNVTQPNVLDRNKKSYTNGNNVSNQYPITETRKF